MVRRMGKALLTAMREGPPERREVASEAALLAPQRGRLLQFYCLHPLASIAEAARATEMADGTVRWHASRLVDSGWLEIHGPTYYVKGLVDPADVPVFEVLGGPSACRLLASVFERPGQSVSDLARSARVSRQAASGLVDDLRAAGVLSVVEDGAFVRLYPTRLLAERRDANAARAAAFCQDVLRRLAADGLAPEVLRRTRSEFHVRFGPPGRRVALDLPIDPFSSALIP